MDSSSINTTESAGSSTACAAILRNTLGVGHLRWQSPYSLLEPTEHEVMPNFLNFMDHGRRCVVDDLLYDGTCRIASHTIEEGLIKACYKRDGVTAMLLISQLPNINSKTKNDETPLSIAINTNFELLALKLIEDGADFIVKCDGKSALSQAIDKQLSKVACSILYKDVNNLIKPNENDFQTAIQKGLTSVVSLMLKKNWNGVFSNDETALHLACQYTQLPLLVPLISKGYLVNALTSEERQSPLHFACMRANEHRTRDVIDTLIKYGSIVDIRDINGHTPLHILCSYHNNTDRDENRFGVFELLINAGADVNATNNFGLRPLHLASRSGSERLVITLILHGADVDVTDLHGRTPLHEACRCGTNNDDVIRILLAHKALIDIHDRWGRTPLDYGRIVDPTMEKRLFKDAKHRVFSGLIAKELESKWKLEEEVKYLRLKHMEMEDKLAQYEKETLVQMSNIVQSNNETNIETYREGLNKNPVIPVALPVKNVASNMDNVASNMDNVASNMDNVASNMDNVSSNMDNVSSNMDNVSSNMDNVSFNMDNVSSNMDNVASNMDNVSSNMDNVSSNMDNVSSNMDNVSSNMDNLAPNMDSLANTGEVDGHLEVVESKVEDTAYNCQLLTMEASGARPKEKKPSKESHLQANDDALEENTVPKAIMDERHLEDSNSEPGATCNIESVTNNSHLLKMEATGARPKERMKTPSKRSDNKPSVVDGNPVSRVTKHPKKFEGLPMTCPVPLYCLPKSRDGQTISQMDKTIFNKIRDDVMANINLEENATARTHSESASENIPSKPEYEVEIPMESTDNLNFVLKKSVREITDQFFIEINNFNDKIHVLNERLQKEMEECSSVIEINLDEGQQIHDQELDQDKSDDDTFLHLSNMEEFSVIDMANDISTDLSDDSSSSNDSSMPPVESYEGGNPDLESSVDVIAPSSVHSCSEDSDYEDDSSLGEPEEDQNAKESDETLKYRVTFVEGDDDEFNAALISLECPQGAEGGAKKQEEGLVKTLPDYITILEQSLNELSDTIKDTQEQVSIEGESSTSHSGVDIPMEEIVRDHASKSHNEQGFLKDLLEEHYLANTIEIINVPVNAKEDLKKFVSQLAEAAKIPFSDYHIKSVFRGESGVIDVSFFWEKTTQEWIDTYLTKWPECNTTWVRNGTTFTRLKDIKLRKKLTLFNHELLERAKAYAAAKNYLTPFYSTGKIYMRKDYTCTAKLINCDEDYLTL